MRPSQRATRRAQESKRGARRPSAGGDRERERKPAREIRERRPQPQEPRRRPKPRAEAKVREFPNPLEAADFYDHPRAREPAAARDYDDDEDLRLAPCPVCGEQFLSSSLEAHANACLRAQRTSPRSPPLRSPPRLQPSPPRESRGPPSPAGSATSTKTAYMRDLEAQIAEKKAREARARQAERAEDARYQDTWDPWGRPGGGAPMRDSQGDVVTDLRNVGRDLVTFSSRSSPTASSSGGGRRSGSGSGRESRGSDRAAQAAYARELDAQVAEKRARDGPRGGGRRAPRSPPSAQQRSPPSAALLAPTSPSRSVIAQEMTDEEILEMQRENLSLQREVIELSDKLLVAQTELRQYQDRYGRL